MASSSPSELLPLLHERFGLTAFRPGQEAVIQRLLDGRSAAAIFPTGGGKSLCYQLPALMFDDLTLVVSPLLALMREQVASLRARGIEAARLDSTLTVQEVQSVMQQISERSLRILYVAPERFFNERFREFIANVPISLFAIDEAHCISQWGHNFRPDYLKLARIARQLDVQRVLALTATATPAVLEDIRRGFNIASCDAIQLPFFRSNLALRITLCSPQSRRQILSERLMSVAGASLVYVTLQKTAEDVAELLAKQGFEARPYHAGLDDDTRQEVQDWFMQSTSGVVVATIAFGMGVDKSNIRGIFHYNPSKSIENLAQEIGRAGRDELPALCETLLVPEDRVILENFAYADTPDIEAISKFVEILIGQPNSFFVSYYANAYETDIRETVVRTLFTFLELSEYLEATSSRYESYQFKPRVSSAEILRHFDGEHRQFASSVLAMTVKKKIWYSISLPQVANRLGCDRTRIVQLLDTFANKGWIELQTSQLVHGYRKIKPLPNNQALAQELHQYVIEREVSELSRLNELFQLMASDECLSAVLAGHFGQRLDVTCGLCSVCTGHPLHRMPDLNYPDLGDSAVTGLQRLKKQHPELLATARQQARFLCGLSSPKMIRGRLTREPLFGCCAEIPFDRVMELLLG